MVKKNPDFRFNRKRKSGKTEFFEVHIERALITHLITVLFATFGVCRKVLTGFIQIKVHARESHSKKGRLNGLIRLVYYIQIGAGFCGSVCLWNDCC